MSLSAICSQSCCPTNANHHFSFIIGIMDQNILLYPMMARHQEKEHSCSVVGGVNWCKLFWGQVIFKTHPPIPVVPFLCICILQMQLSNFVYLIVVVFVVIVKVPWMSTNKNRMDCCIALKRYEWYETIFKICYNMKQSLILVLTKAKFNLFRILTA